MKLSLLAQKGLAGVLTMALLIGLLIYNFKHSFTAALLTFLLADLAVFSQNYGFGLNNCLTRIVFEKIFGKQEQS